MTTVQVPKFSFGGATIKTEAEMAVVEGNSGNGDKYLKPGHHEVSITAVEYTGLAKDTNWGKFTLILTGTGGKTCKAFLIVPFRDVMYVSAAGKPTAFMYTKFKKFMSALGVTITVDSLGDVLPQYFGNGGKALVGLNLAIEMGYDGDHVVYAGKSDTGEKKYNIKRADGGIVMDKQLQILNFPDFASAGNYAEANQIKIQKFAEILNFLPSSTPNQAAVGNW